MKKIYALGLFVFGFMACQKESPRPPKLDLNHFLRDCPDIMPFISNVFPNESVLKIEKYIDEGKEEIDIYLSNKIELEYDINCTLTEIVAPSGIPDAAFPISLVDYVRLNFPGSIIVKWELYTSYQEIKLSNGLYLEFSLDGRFLRIDD
jgi:hypothetical protein